MNGIAAILASRSAVQPATVTGASTPGDPGMAAILRSRAGIQFHVSIGGVATGYAGDPYSDATHELMVQNRNSVYTSNPPLQEDELQRWEKLWNFWWPFYASPYKAPDPDGMTAPQREIWFREEAVKWQNFFKARQPQRFEAGTPIWPYALGAAVILGGIAIAAGK